MFLCFIFIRVSLYLHSAVLKVVNKMVNKNGAINKQCVVLYHDSRHFEKSHFDMSEVPYAVFSLLASRTGTDVITTRKFMIVYHLTFVQKLY